MKYSKYTEFEAEFPTTKMNRWKVSASSEIHNATANKYEIFYNEKKNRWRTHLLSFGIHGCFLWGLRNYFIHFFDDVMPVYAVMWYRLTISCFKFFPPSLDCCWFICMRSVLTSIIINFFRLYMMMIKCISVYFGDVVWPCVQK